MKDLSIRYKFVLPVFLMLTIVVLVVSWLFASTQATEAETAFHSHLETMAVNSSAMMHVLAAEYAEAHGMTFHRVSIKSTTGVGEAEQLGLDAIRKLAADPHVKSVTMQGQDTTGAVMYVYAPARTSEQCMLCHSAYGMDTFKDVPDGTLVAAFGVSGSLAPLQTQKSRIIVIALGIGALVTAFITMIILGMVGRVVVRPLQGIVEQTSHLASGDLTVSLPVTSQDELGKLGGAFNSMAETLRQTIHRVREAVGDVSSAVTEINASAEEMAAGAREQSSQAGAVATATEQMTKSIVDNSHNASRAAASAAEAKHSAKEGGVVVSQSVEGMKRIAAVVTRSAQAVEELGKSGDRIGEIVSVINDIADQTNMLALNAAIEAARVGEAGRGFAVVADEVRKLADRTTSATKEIAAMIKEIQTQTRQAVSAMTQGTTEVQKGIAMADNAGEALQRIVEGSKKLTDMVAQMASASEEQSRSSEMISSSIDAINRVTGETSQGSQQVAQATEDLNRLTEMLQQSVSIFKVDA